MANAERHHGTSHKHKLQTFYRTVISSDYYVFEYEMR